MGCWLGGRVQVAHAGKKKRAGEKNTALRASVPAQRKETRGKFAKTGGRRKNHLGNRKTKTCE